MALRCGLPCFGKIERRNTIHNADRIAQSGASLDQRLISKRSKFITLFQAATKSLTNLTLASSAA